MTWHILRLRATLCFFLTTAILTTSCAGLITWRTVYSSRSPDKQLELLLQESSCFADCALQLTIQRGWASTPIATMYDCSLGFAHAVWQGNKVAVFVDGGYCGTHTVAFDLASERPAPFSSLEPLLRASIIKSYSVSAQELAAHNGDVFHWATYHGDGRPSRGNMEFRERWRR